MAILRMSFAITLLTAMSFSSVSQEPAPAPEEAAPPAEAVPQPPDTRPLDEIFIPSEEIAADEEIVFPVNI